MKQPRSAVVLIVLALAVTAHAADQLVANPAMDAGEPLAGWKVANKGGVTAELAADTTVFRSPPAALRVRLASAGGAFASQRLVRGVSGRIAIAAAVRIDGDVTGSMPVQVFDAAWKQLAWLEVAHAIRPAAGWQEIHGEVTLPAGAANVLVGLALTGTGTGWLDDLSVLPAVATPEPVVDSSPLPHPPAVIIKLDDLKGSPQLWSQWQRVADYADGNGIKLSIGIICDSLEQADPRYVAWVKTEQARGNIEFWLHAYDHAVHVEDGKKYCEFVHRPLAEQQRRLALCASLAKDRLGIVFHTFGPPGGVAPTIDATTLDAVSATPDLRVILYPSPLDAPARRLQEAGRVTILDRVWEVNLESRVGVADYAAFVAGFVKHLDRPYVVLQGHPASWDAARWGEFVRIVDYLRARGCEFVLPDAYAQRLKPH